MRVAFTTLGCRLNQFETEGMRQRFERELPGSSSVEFEDSADVYVINSCAVTARAEQKCRQLARQVKRRNPTARVVVAGCYAQLAGGSLADRDEIDAVLGNEEKRRLPDFLDRIDSGERVVSVAGYRRGQVMAEEWIDEFGGLSRATLKVQEGCDLRCAFCAVWRARGPSRSRDPRQVVELAERLAASGYEEIVLAGVQIGHYGNDLDPRTDLAELLGMLLDVVDPRVRFRLSSIDPSAVSERLVEMLAAEPRLCRYLHLPLQSGSDGVLARMRRAYTASDYCRLVDQITALDPTFGIGADVIVGFPGETDEEFAETHALLDALPVSFYHVFRYSDREKTAAVGMAGKVDGRTVGERSRVLRELGERKQREFLARHVGRRYRGILESVDETTGVGELMLDDYSCVSVREPMAATRQQIEVVVDRIDEEDRLWGRSVLTSAESGRSE